VVQLKLWSCDGCKIHVYFKLEGPGVKGCLLFTQKYVFCWHAYISCSFLTEDGVAVQETLFEKTKQKTVPNVFVNGKHVGGCDATIQAHKDGRLAELLSGVKYDYDLIVIGGGSGGLAASKVSVSLCIILIISLLYFVIWEICCI